MFGSIFGSFLQVIDTTSSTAIRYPVENNSTLLKRIPLLLP